MHKPRCYHCLIFVLFIMHINLQKVESQDNTPVITGQSNIKDNSAVAQVIKDKTTNSVNNNPVSDKFIKDHVKSKFTKKSVLKLIEEPSCKNDIPSVCDNNLQNNFAVLECIQSKARDDSHVVSPECHHLLWNYKLNLTRTGRIEELAKNVCDMELERFTDCQKENEPGHTISCITDNLDKIKDERCHQYIVKLAAIVFSDYRLVSKMTDNCRNDIERFTCGRVELLPSDATHSQGSTIECLSQHTAELAAKCQKQILRLAELQADDFHLDRPLFFACRLDRETFCKTLKAGDGRIYKCLLKNKNERGMSKECELQLSRRQKLMVQDYKVSHGLAKSCRMDIQKYQCRKGMGDETHDVKLSLILLCLEGSLRNGNNIDHNCQEEMLSHRRMLMEDYQLSPDMVASCKNELNTFCGGGVQTGGRTLHCLMKHARGHKNKKFSPECHHQIEYLVKEADAGEDWRADPVLFEACSPAVESMCKNVRGGEARVLRCLMRHLNTNGMPGACQAALLEIQYFIARDWKLDPQLYTACYNDSVKFCEAKKDWFKTNDDQDTDNAILVLPCLFRYAYHPRKDLRLLPTCLEEVKRIMHERASYVDLHPEIELACMSDLADLCSSKTGPGGEIACLQENFEDLDEECGSVVKNYTEAEAKDAGLNSMLNLHCSTVIPKICNPESQSDDIEGQLMECLINKKNIQVMRETPKCRAVVESFQVLALKSYSFTPRFKTECQNDVGKFCPDVKNKKDVIECLSGRIRDDILNDDRPQVSRGCRQQLRQQIAQRHENIKFDPTLKRVCQDDVQRLCRDSSHGQGQILECLKRNHKDLDVECHKIVFKRQQEMMSDPGTDVVLVTDCKSMIQTFCRNADYKDVFKCLKLNKDNLEFDSKCRNIITKRMIEQSTDTRLNPELRKACRIDMAKFCPQIFENTKNDNQLELNGKLTECLKKQLPKRKLSSQCTNQITLLTRNSALNFKMDPILKEACEDDMKVLCVDYMSGDEGKGRMEECLKLQLEMKKIMSATCQVHVAHIIETQRADLHADPLLFQACTVDDAKFCQDKDRGYHLACLFDVLDRNAAALEITCRGKLRERREMFNAAIKVAKLESIQDLVMHVQKSPERNYLLLVFVSILGFIFIGGLFCGRSTRRYRFLKER